MRRDCFSFLFFFFFFLLEVTNNGTETHLVIALTKHHNSTTRSLRAEFRHHKQEQMNHKSQDELSTVLLSRAFWRKQSRKVIFQHLTIESAANSQVEFSTFPRVTI